MNLKELIPIGTTGSRSVEVTPELTVAHHLPQLPPVYATPHMIHLMEAAAGGIIEPLLPAGWVTVGAAINVQHLAATPVGFVVTATAEVVAVKDAVIEFRVEAHDGIDVIGRGTHVRAPIELARFMAGVAKKTARRG